MSSASLVTPLAFFETKIARRNLNLFSLSSALAVLQTVGLSFSFMPDIIPYPPENHHRTLQSAGVVRATGEGAG